MERVNSVGAVAQMVERLLSMQEAGGSMPPSSTFQISKIDTKQKKTSPENSGLAMKKEVTAVGFEPTPFRTAALTQRLRPLGHAVDVSPNADAHDFQ